MNLKASIKAHKFLLFFILILMIGALIGMSILTVKKEPLSGGKSGNGTVVTYPFADGMDKFNDLSVLVQDKKDTTSLKLYAVNTNPKRAYPDDSSLFKTAAVAMFDMKGKVTIAVTYPKEVKSLTIRPARAGISPKIEGKTVIFDISNWGQYSVEVNGDATANNLLIFANPPAESVPSGAKLIKGKIDGALNIESGETVYLAPGSVVTGPVTMGSNSKLLGRGILTQGGPPAINAVMSSNVEIDGISIFDPNNWVLQLLDSDNVKIHNVKIISSRNNGDGITIQSSHKIDISKCFVRSWDDSIVLKNYTKNNTYDVNVSDTILWTDLAQSLEIGFETNKSMANADAEIHDVSFNRLDILHAYHKAPISIHNADSCSIYNITYKNLIIEDAQMGEGDGWPYLIDFGNGSSAELDGSPDWTHNDGARLIKNVRVKNIWVLSGNKASNGIRLLNQDSGGSSVMTDIQLENIYYKKEALDYSKEIKAAGLDGTITQKNLPYFHW